MIFVWMLVAGAAIAAVVDKVRCVRRAWRDVTRRIP